MYDGDIWRKYEFFNERVIQEKNRDMHSDESQKTINMPFTKQSKCQNKANVIIELISFNLMTNFLDLPRSKYSLLSKT